MSDLGNLQAQPLKTNRFRMFPDTLTAYQGHSMLLANVEGRLEGELQGFYHRKTRFLSRFTFELNGQRPLFASANGVESESLIAYYLAAAPPCSKPTSARDDEQGSRLRGIEIQVNRFVDGGLHQDFYLTNHVPEAFEVELTFEVAADFHDLAAPPREKEPADRAGTRIDWEQDDTGGTLRLAFEHPDLPHTTLVRFPGGRDELAYADGRVRYRLQLEPQQPVHLCISTQTLFLGRPVPLEPCHHQFYDHHSPRARARRRWLEAATRLVTPCQVVQDAWERAVTDLASLPLFDGPGARIYTPAAGIPIFQALYGRDALTTGMQTGMLGPLMLLGAIETIADLLGDEYDPVHDEQPGRTLHQKQRGPTALVGQTPYIGYYGDYAGPGLFLLAVAMYVRWTGDVRTFRRLEPKVKACLAWMDRDGDLDGDGFYEYETEAGEKGTRNQGWKDSPEAFMDGQGKPIRPPIAAVEIQAYYQAAKRELGGLYFSLGDHARARELLAEAADLRRRFNEAFWLPDEKILALALGPDKRPLASVASNAGHCLACGTVDRDKARAVADRLMARDMFSGWGIRTISSDHPAYNPLGYHLGTVWPSENATIAYGLARYGFTDHVHRIAKGVYEATRLFDENRLPEAIGGHPRDERHPHPGIYPESCAPQAWSASAVIFLLQTLLGMRPDALSQTLYVDPHLPEWLPVVLLDGLEVGHARVRLRFRRRGDGTTSCEVLDADRGLQVVTRPMAPGARPRSRQHRYAS